MTKKRYAIVRVDGSCPSGTYDGCKVNLVCVQERKRIKVTERNCKFCLYGDTKEQLIRKVAQVLIKDEMKYCQPKTEVHKRISWQNNMELAKQIVEFLGVEDDKEKRRKKKEERRKNSRV